MRKIHYSGGVDFTVGDTRRIRLAGWPACMTGDRARAVRDLGNQTDVPNDVTCRQCNKMWLASL